MATNPNVALKKPKGLSNKKQTYYEYVANKKARNHKCREAWASVLNKNAQHCINLGQGLESCWRDYEGTSVIFSSDGNCGPAFGNFDKHNIQLTAKRFKQT